MENRKEARRIIAGDYQLGKVLFFGLPGKPNLGCIAGADPTGGDLRMYWDRGGQPIIQDGRLAINFDRPPTYRPKKNEPV